MSALKKQIALVTGGGRGIGKAIAVALARAGVRVVITARTTSELEEVVGAIQAKAAKRPIALSKPRIPRDAH